ncbi:peptidase M23-like protein [Motilibacter peucedani]|uniref:Peptidase M23-like protein n=1 Tax=Motilibacter peucedani TaxID=598650 RepID=A0A420XRB7_9ACTN|nr:M23 family metallopeptidase [Motilibacter peucedani]RKS77359.1 peptidase M23-like protein [Motilibacter peucedani]
MPRLPHPRAPLLLLGLLLAALWAAAGWEARPARAAPAWRAPLTGPLEVVRPFDAPAQPWLPGHRGVDLAAGPGEQVLAAGSGVVLFAGPVGGRGVVSVGHGALRTTYEPVVPAAGVRSGAVVSAGQVLGVVAAAAGHCSPAACLHWGLLRGATYLDPLLLLGAAGPPRLLPLDGPVTGAPLRGGAAAPGSGSPARGSGTPAEGSGLLARAAPRRPPTGGVPRTGGLAAGAVTGAAALLLLRRR